MHYPETKGSMTESICIRVKEPFKQFFTSDGRQLLESYPVSYLLYENNFA